MLDRAGTPTRSRSSACELMRLASGWSLEAIVVGVDVFDGWKGAGGPLDGG